MDKGTAGKVEISPILAWSDIKYIAPVTYPDPVRVTFDIVKIEEDRLHGQAHLYSNKLDRLVAISNNTLKAYNMKLLKKAPIPQRWVELLREHYGDSI